MSEKISWSRVECWRQCPKKYFYRYIEKRPTEFKDDPKDPLILGSTLDLGIQKGYEEAREYYRSQYPVITTEGETELVKIRHLLPRLRETFSNGQFQVKLETSDFIGFIDYLEDDILLDFKYSNNVEDYVKSGQIHVYASMIPKSKRPKHIGYVFIPKTFIKKKEPENLMDFDNRETIQEYRQRCLDELDKTGIKVRFVDYDQSLVDQFWEDAKKMQEETEFNITPNKYCSYCDYRLFCGRPIRKRAPKTK